MTTSAISPAAVKKEELGIFPEPRLGIASLEIGELEFYSDAEAGTADHLTTTQTVTGTNESGGTTV